TSNCSGCIQQTGQRPRNTLSHGVHLCPPEGIQATDIFPKTSSKLHEKEDTRGENSAQVCCNLNENSFNRILRHHHE
ncbi:MAG: hypothetical protein LBE62_00815, partial [Azonexus sp.]|nr:hypothetical protein [Azonexus sp.]